MTTPGLYNRFTSIGPLLETLGNGGKGIGWNTQHEMDFLRGLNGTAANGQFNLEKDIDAIEAVLTLTPETNGEVAVKAWEDLSKFTGREHAYLTLPEEDEKIRYREIQAQPRKVIPSPTWSASRAKRSATTPAIPTSTS